MFPVGLYVHIPFCIRKCPYCDFFSLPITKNDVTEYLDALEIEAGLISRQYPLEFQTLYIGGGTPSVLSGVQMNRLFKSLNRYFRLSKVREITVEANPRSLTKRVVQTLKSSGVNRISLGVQAFTDSQLSILQRDATKKVYQAYDLLRDEGFNNINFDLIYGVPEQSMADWEYTLSEAVRLNPEHISCYSLILEKGTPFTNLHALGRLPLPDDEEEAKMYESAMDFTHSAGYVQYEISNFARPGYECQHNLIYWHNHNWLGLGPSAHSHINGRRFWNISDLQGYFQRLAEVKTPKAGEENRELGGQRDETAILQLRLNEGIDLKKFGERFGAQVFFQVYGDTLSKFTSLGLLKYDENRVYLTRKGRLLGNQVFQGFLVEEEK